MNSRTITYAVERSIKIRAIKKTMFSLDSDKKRLTKLVIKTKNIKMPTSTIRKMISKISNNISIRLNNLMLQQITHENLFLSSYLISGYIIIDYYVYFYIDCLYYEFGKMSQICILNMEIKR